ncbi:hypothetical protein B5E77_16470 [Lachnoclostridium sp. An131]|nr:hypothetical protein B5E77_16470 [Lachnoclostridium sp. An131]
MMSKDIAPEYKDFECIKQLGVYQEAFIKLVECYGQELNGGRIIIEDSVYTLHDFDHHCIEIYKIISDVLLDPKRAYSSPGLTKRELYILDMAVLFHDISMSQDIMAKRESHSKSSADYVQELFDNTKSLFSKESQLTINELNALKAIIIAHSDIKDGTVPPEEQGLGATALSKPVPAKSGMIRPKLLAGILRLADELDVTNERLGCRSIEESLRKCQEKFENMKMQLKVEEGEGLLEAEYEKYEKYVESLSYWKNLYLFSEVRREMQDDTIQLITDDRYIRELLEQGNTPPAIARKILKIYEKIDKEWKNIKKFIIDDSSQKVDVKSFFPVSEINIQCGLEEVRQELEKQLFNIYSSQDVTVTNVQIEAVKEDDGEEKRTLEQLQEEVQIIDRNLSDKLMAETKRRHLLKVGHFLLDDIFCARDWIDTKEIVETKAIADKINACFIEHIKKNIRLDEKNVIIGLDLEGALLASRIGMSLKLPFTYIIPVRDQPNFSKKELEVSIKEFDGIILIADVIVAFDTIKKALNEISNTNGINEQELLNKVVMIYSIFYRESNLISLKGLGELKKKTCCLNMDFPVELFRKKECHYMKNNECLALNCRSKNINSKM